MTFTEKIKELAAKPVSHYEKNTILRLWVSERYPDVVPYAERIHLYAVYGKVTPDGGRFHSIDFLKHPYDFRKKISVRSLDRLEGFLRRVIAWCKEETETTARLKKACRESAERSRDRERKHRAEAIAHLRKAFGGRVKSGVISDPDMINALLSGKLTISLPYGEAGAKLLAELDSTLYRNNN